jgi:hypothetical protein
LSQSELKSFFKFILKESIFLLIILDLYVI